jgi:hypothetical protein
MYLPPRNKEKSTYMVQSARTNSLWSRITATFGHWPGIGTVLIAAALLRLASIPLVRSYLHP